MTAKSLENLLNLNNDGELGEVLRRAQALGELTETLSKALPGELSDGLVAVNIRDDSDQRELVALARSSAWASRLRFEQEALRTSGEEGARLRQSNPLGRVPALVLDGGQVLPEGGDHHAPGDEPADPRVDPPRLRAPPGERGRRVRGRLAWRRSQSGPIM